MLHAHSHIRYWFILAERGLLRLAMIALGLVLIVVGLAMGVSMVMLLPGIVIGFVGVGLVVWGTVGELPMD